MNRWRMHKLGFVHFWLYDLQEFPIDEGHILLRGSNASGKSITTQSFIPFLLDGNKSPERLDPFGSKDRRMEFYLLGDGEREESTGYLYLEFKKIDSNEYLTIGVGMRAQKGKSMDFWGFCLCDGRRMGDEGMRLYEKVGKELLPLSKQKLRNLLNDPDNWAEGQTEYKRLVNQRVFQFQDINQYDQLISLLIKVRAPKLSREAFRPSGVKTILNDSLQVLSDEDLSAMVSTMERMDMLEQTLRDYRTAMRDAQTIRVEYTRYNQYVLGGKGRVYLEAQNRHQLLASRLAQAEALLGQQETELAREQRCGAEAAQRLEQAQAQQMVQEESDLRVKQRQLDAEQGREKDAASQQKTLEEQLGAKREGIDRDELRLRADTQRREDERASMHRSMRTLDEQNEVLDLGEEHASFADLVKREAVTQSACQNLQDAVSRRKKQIAQMLVSLRQLAQAQHGYDEAYEALDAAATKTRNAKITYKDAEFQEQEERDKLLEAFARYRGANRELLLSSEGFVAVRQAIIHYRSNVDRGILRDVVDGAFDASHQALIAQQLAEAYALNETKAALAQQREEYEQLRPEPVPPRSAQVEATRAVLAQRNIPCAPFFETVDFRPDLPQEDRDRLEAQLADAGLLDALVVPETHQASIAALLAEHPDRFLVPGAPVAEPLAELIPDERSAVHAAAARCLRSISCADMGAQTALLPNGAFRSGALRGHSHAQQQASFVGVSARCESRKRQLALLKAHIDALMVKQTQGQARMAALEARMQVLLAEKAAMPLPTDLDQALGLMEKARQELCQAEELEAKRARAEQEAKAAVSRLEQQGRELSVGIPYLRKLDAYEEAQESAEGYQESLTQLNGRWRDFCYAARSVQELEERIDQARDEADSLSKMLDKQIQSLALSRAQIKELQQFLSLPENQNVARRIAELEEEIRKQRGMEREARERCVALNNDLQHTRQTLERCKEELTPAVLEEQAAACYFAEDLALGLSLNQESRALSECARMAQGKVAAADRARTPEKMSESLQNNYLQHNNTLLKYSPQMALCFDAPEHVGLLRERQVITLKKDGRELSLYAFIDSLQTDITSAEQLLLESDRELFEDILTNTISSKLRHHIEESQRWSLSMSELMRGMDTSMGLTFSLEWKPRKGEGEEQLDTANLVRLLSKDSLLLTREDSQKVSSHFRAKVKIARENAELLNQSASYADLIHKVLDYRNWYEFQIFFQRMGEAKRELTDRVFNTFSGGEKAMAIYLPQFAAVSAQYQKGGAGCPCLLALDEAFAGVDDKNIQAMFKLVHKLGFDYIMNSQALWGCYADVPNLDIAEFYRPANAQVVTILRYHWDGREKTLLEG
ncbi:MAG: TIGR02680 family protein [Clostridia bacterium]